MLDKTRRHYLAGFCHICKAENPLLTCGICKMVSYCCVEHRRQDWQDHSHICRAIHKFCTRKGVSSLYESVRDGTAVEYRDLRHLTAMELSETLGRTLKSWELEMLYWPKICEVCYSQDDNLEVCHGCAFVYRCSGHSRAYHDKWCPSLRLYQQIVRQIERDGLVPVPTLTIPSQFSTMRDILDINKSSSLVSAFASEVLTYPLTIRQALLTHLPELTQLTVHMVGAELQAEVLPLSKWEHYLLHLLPACRIITLVFVGPDLQAPEEILLSGQLPLCSKCREEKKILNYQIVANTMYHDLKDAKPDLIVALNDALYRSIGFNGKDSWTPTLQKILIKKENEVGVPVLVTEYTNCEIEKDLELLKQRYPNVRILQQPQVNPFAATRPSLNVISDDTVPVIFKNYFSLTISP